MTNIAYISHPIGVASLVIEGGGDDVARNIYNAGLTSRTGMGDWDVISAGKDQGGDSA